MKKIYSALLIVLLNCGLAQGQIQQRVQQACEEYSKSRFLNAVYMFSDGQQVLAQGAQGTRSLKTSQPLTADEQMPIASGTKTMTAAAILKLQDKKLLDVHDSIDKYMPADSGFWEGNKLPQWASKVTLHHLLTHHSGLPEYFMVAKLDTTKPHAEIAKQISQFAGGMQLMHQPGEKFFYCNTNYVLLGIIIEKISGMTLAEFMQKEFFKPLEMHNTRMATLEEVLKHQEDPDATHIPNRFFITPTGSKDKVMFNLAQVPHKMVPLADGGVLSTTADLITWHHALHNGKVLSPESYKLMTTKHYSAPTKADGMTNYTGYGLYISLLPNNEIIYHHPGNAVAIRSESGYVPSQNLYFAVLSNVMTHIPKNVQDKLDIKDINNQLDIKYFLMYVLNKIAK